MREWRELAVAVHTLFAILRFRSLAIKCGYEDVGDCDTLRTGLLFELAVGWEPKSDGALCSQTTVTE